MNHFFSSMIFDLIKYALVCGLFAGTMLAILGIFVVGKRSLFAGLAVSQLAGLGSVLGAVLAWHSGEFVLAFGIILLAMSLYTVLSKNKFVPPETWIAALHIFAASLCVLILANFPHGETSTLNVLFGNILSLGISEVWESIAIFAIGLCTLGIGFDRWVWITLNPESAEVSGLNLKFWNFIFYCLFALAMTVSVHIFGVLLAFSYLVLPATIALTLGKTMRQVVTIAIGSIVGSTVAGLAVSVAMDWPSSPAIAAILAALAILSKLFSGK